MADTIIIIRGNSGSGKTTVAKELCKKLGSDCMLLSQDVIRRDILHTKDGENNTAIDLLKMLIMYGKTQSKIIILEGILKFQWYSSIFDVIKKILATYIHIIMIYRLKKLLKDLKPNQIQAIPKKI